MAAAAALRRQVAEHWPGAAAVVWSGALLLWRSSRLGRYVVDDAAISFAYARNIATLHGPVLQAGARPVEGFSNPAWVALLVVGRWLGLFDRGTILGVPDYVVYPRALALLFCLGIVVCCYVAALTLLACRWAAALVAAVCGTALAGIPSFVIWCFSGLENSLYAFLVTVLAVALLMGIVGGWLLSPRLAPALRAVAASGVAFAAVFGTYLVARRLEFGRWVPNTAVAKSQQTPTLTGADRAADLIQYPGWAVVAVAAVCTVGAMATTPHLRRVFPALIVPLALAVAAYCVLNPDWMGQLRFATPVWPVAVLLAALSVAYVAARPGVRYRLGLWTAILVSVVLAERTLSPLTGDFIATRVAPLCEVAERYGEVFNGYADIAAVRKGSLLLPDLGGTALTSRLRLSDLAGLADARIAPYLQSGDDAGLRDYIYDDLKPTFIHAHGIWLGSVQGTSPDPRLTRDYDEIYASEPYAADWIRKDAESSPAVLGALQHYAQTEVPVVDQRAQDDPLRSCGDRLRAGMTPGG